MRSVGMASRSIGWLEEKRLSRLMLIFGAVLLIALVVGIFTFLFVQDMVAFGTFPKAVSIVGVNVSGLSKDQAVARCKVELADVANRPLTLKLDDGILQASPAEIGLKLNYDKMVNQAYKEAWSVNIFERMARRFMNKPKEINVSLATGSNDALVQGFLQRAMGVINRVPQDAYVDVTSGSAVIVPAKNGRQTDYNQLYQDTKKALGDPKRTVNVKLALAPAAIQDSVFGRLIIINLAAHNLTLFERDKPIAQFPVACGQPSWPTPAGIWKVIEKQRNPSWKNPGSSWAKSMPPYIAPGPGNPLGTRALATNASGVLIHGTSSRGSIGTSASHGCVRMFMEHVEQLFEMVEVNTPVYIIKAPGNPGFDVTKKPFWWK